jgi:hypothetical protein
MTDKATAHEPVEGDVIPRSSGKMTAAIGGLVILSLFGVFLIWAYFTGFALPLPSASIQLNWLGAAVGFGAAIIGPLLTFAFAVMLALKERIVLGNDRLQRLQRLGKADKVTTQIPYRNIANLACDTDEGARFLGIDLIDADDADTFDTASNFAREKNTYGWHFRILGGYQKDLRTLHDMLAKRLEDYQQSQPT